MNVKKHLQIGAWLIAGLGFFAPAQAQELVTNGGFELTSHGANKGVGAGSTLLTGWTATDGAYDFVFSDINASIPASPTALSLWNQTNGGGGQATNSPTGGNFYAFDPAVATPGPITQTLKNLQAGTYQVSFDWAVAQQYGYSSGTWGSWTVQLGSAAAQATATVNNPSRSFTGWMHETMSFTVGAGDAVLSFLGKGGPQGVPPFALLDSVSVVAVPEPSTYALLLLGLAAVAAVARRKSRAGGPSTA